MTIAYWCILVAAVLPYIWVGFAKSKPNYNNNAPRDYLSQVEGWRKRAGWAHNNAFEAFPAFAAAVLVAEAAKAPQTRIDLCAMLFIAFRISHGLAYITDKAPLRSSLWLAGFLCVVAL